MIALPKPKEERRILCPNCGKFQAGKCRYGERDHLGDFDCVAPYDFLADYDCSDCPLIWCPDCHENAVMMLFKIKELVKNDYIA